MVSGCGVATAPIGERQEAVYFGDTGPGTIWQDPTHIRVCWTNPTPDNQAFRDQVRTAVETGYADTRIGFWDWGACPGWTSISAIRIKVQDGTADSSTDPLTVLPGIANNMTLGHNAAGSYFTYTAIHEFGHALGTQHEQDRPNTACYWQQRFPFNPLAFFLGPYDPQSIWNYCAPDPPQLSDLDKYGVDFVYGARGVFEQHYGGVYRHVDGTMCHVSDPDQLASFNPRLAKLGRTGAQSVVPLSVLPGPLPWPWTFDRYVGECNWPAGFYRAGGGPVVFARAATGQLCTVQNPEQMMAFGGWNLVTDVSGNANLSQGRPSGAPPCVWGDGFYQTDGYVWQLSSTGGANPHMCAITPENFGWTLQPLGVAALALPSGDSYSLATGRIYDGWCPNLPDPVPLPFDRGDTRRDTSEGLWVPPQLNFVAECGASEAMSGLSTGAMAHSALCAVNDDTKFLHQSCHPVEFDNGDSVISRDWDYGYFKGECAPNEYVAGISQDQGGRGVNWLLCCQGNINRDPNRCATKVLGAPGTDGLEANSLGIDWTTAGLYTYTKAECGDIPTLSSGKPSRFIGGVSRFTGSGQPHAILCCDP
jgi:hypothetical protein